MALFPGPSICVTIAMYATATKHYSHCASPTMVEYLSFKYNGDVSTQEIYVMTQTTSQFTCMATYQVRGLALVAGSITLSAN